MALGGDRHVTQALAVADSGSVVSVGDLAWGRHQQLVAKDAGHLPGAFEVLRRGSLPLAGVTVLLIIGLMVWQHVTEERLSLPTRPAWDSDRSPFPGLEAFTEKYSAVFVGRDAEITELVERLHPVVTGQANRLVAVVGPQVPGSRHWSRPPCNACPRPSPDKRSAQSTAIPTTVSCSHLLPSRTAPQQRSRYGP